MVAVLDRCTEFDTSSADVPAVPHLTLVDPAPQPSPGLYRRRQLVALAIAAAMVWLTVSTAMTLASWAVGPSQPVFAPSDGPTVHFVGPGDTVWSIARQYQPNGDVRPFVDRLINLNGGTDIVVGQQLILSP